MAKGFGKRLAEAAAIMAANVTQGYGEGRLKTAMSAREEYQQRLKEERASVAQEQERGWRTEEAEKEREHDFAKMEKAQEFDAASQDRTLQNQLTLAKMRGTGKGGSSAGGITRTITDAEGKVWGITKTGEKIDLEIQGKAGSTSSGGGGKESSYMVRAREQEMLDSKTEGRSFNEANVARNYKAISGGRSSDASDTVKPETIAKALQSEYEARSERTHPGYRDWRKMDENQKRQLVGSAVLGNYESAGAAVPEEFASKYRQQSQDEVAQPQAVPGVATSTQGDKPTDAIPTGAGTQESPYVVETEAQAEWAMKHAPPGAYIKDVAGGRLVRKPIK